MRKTVLVGLLLSSMACADMSMPEIELAPSTNEQHIIYFKKSLSNIHCNIAYRMLEGAFIDGPFSSEEHGKYSVTVLAEHGDYTLTFDTITQEAIFRYHHISEEGVINELLHRSLPGTHLSDERSTLERLMQHSIKILKQFYKHECKEYLQGVEEIK